MPLRRQRRSCAYSVPYIMRSCWYLAISSAVGFRAAALATLTFAAASFSAAVAENRPRWVRCAILLSQWGYHSGLAASLMASQWVGHFLRPRATNIFFWQGSLHQA